MVASPTLKAQDQSANSTAVGSTPPPAETTDQAQPAANADQAQPTLALPALQTIKPKENEVSVSSDFMLGQGTFTFPVGYSLVKALSQSGFRGTTLPSATVAKPTRSSDYFGGTISYSYGQAWYLDLSYSEGNSSGNQTFSLGGNLGNSLNDFTLKDNWYQAYIRYAFPQYAASASRPIFGPEQPISIPPSQIRQRFRVLVSIIRRILPPSIVETWVRA